jgi:hypothetical protein
MVKTTFAVAVLTLGLGFAAISNSYAAGVTPPNDAAFTSNPMIVDVAHRFCPVNILCVKGRVARCHFSRAQDRCVCRCVRRSGD